MIRGTDKTPRSPISPGPLLLLRLPTIAPGTSRRGDTGDLVGRVKNGGRRHVMGACRSGDPWRCVGYDAAIAPAQPTSPLSAPRTERVPPPVFDALLGTPTEVWQDHVRRASSSLRRTPRGQSRRALRTIRGGQKDSQGHFSHSVILVSVQSMRFEGDNTPSWGRRTAHHHVLPPTITVALC